MSEEIALAAADVAFWRQRAEQSAAFALTLQAQRDQAEADALALRDGICRYAEAAPDARGALYHRLFVLTVAEHPGAQLLFELAAARARVVELERQIEQAREILSALENETLAEAANDLVREEQTSNEAYHKIHALYWKKAMPELAQARAIVTTLRMHRDAGGEVWHSIDADLAAYDAAKARAE